MSDKLESTRKDYAKHRLNKADLVSNPLAQLNTWLHEAHEAQPDDHNAMTLCTLDADGMPQARIVLLRKLDQGLVFYTNYNSHKGQALAANPKCSALFFWPELERQVRISGIAAKISAEESDAYFNTRPRESQLGAWASDQSEEISSHAALEEKVRQVTARFEGRNVPRPEHWGGYRLTPNQVEFWQGRPSRLHDRFVYKLDSGVWSITRIQP